MSMHKSPVTSFHSAFVQAVVIADQRDRQGEQNIQVAQPVKAKTTVRFFEMLHLLAKRLRASPSSAAAPINKVAQPQT